jgi:hypothetical protein
MQEKWGWGAALDFFWVKTWPGREGGGRGFFLFMREEPHFLDAAVFATAHDIKGGVGVPLLCHYDAYHYKLGSFLHAFSCIIFSSPPLE